MSVPFRVQAFCKYCYGTGLPYQRTASRSHTNIKAGAWHCLSLASLQICHPQGHPTAAIPHQTAPAPPRAAPPLRRGYLRGILILGTRQGAGGCQEAGCPWRLHRHANWWAHERWVGEYRSLVRGILRGGYCQALGYLLFPCQGLCLQGFPHGCISVASALQGFVFRLLGECFACQFQPFSMHE